VIRALAVTGIFLVAAGTGLPAAVSAQTSLQGQAEAVGLLFLLGASRPGGQTSVKTLGQKPKPSMAVSPKVEARIADVKQKPPGGGPTVSIPDRVVRPSARLDGAVLRVTSDQANRAKLGRPVELTDREHAKHN